MKYDIIKGFTFIELICVVAVIILLSCISLPSFRNINRVNKLNISTYELIGDLRRAKMYAISNNSVVVRVKFDKEINSENFIGYKIYYFKNGNTIFLTNRTFRDSIIIDGSKSTFMNGGIGDNLEFNSSGSVNIACSIVLRNLINNISKKVTLTIGYTRIEAL